MSESPQTPRLAHAIGAANTIVAVLADRKYDLAERWTDGNLSAQQMRSRLAELAPWPFIVAPRLADSGIQAVLLGRAPESWRIRVPLWSGDRPTEVVLSFAVKFRADGSTDTVIEAIDRISGPSFDPGAVTRVELGRLDAERASRVEAGDRMRAERMERLRMLPPPALPPAVDRPLRRALHDLVEGRYERICGLPMGPTTEQLENILAEYGGGWVLAPHVIPYGAEVIYYTDVPDSGVVDCRLWTADGESDVVVSFELSRASPEDDYTALVLDIKVP